MQTKTKPWQDVKAGDRIRIDGFTKIVRRIEGTGVVIVFWLETPPARGIAPFYFGRSSGRTFEAFDA